MMFHVKHYAGNLNMYLEERYYMTTRVSTSKRLW